MVAGWHALALRSITVGHAICGLSNAYSSPVGLHDGEGETGSRPDKGCTGVGGSMPVITNGYEEQTLSSHLKEDMMSTVRQLSNGQNCSDSYVL